MFAGSKKYTRDVSEVAAVFMGSKKCTRNSVGCSLRSWVQKNIPVMSVKLRLCLRVQRNVSAIVLVALCVRGLIKIYP